MNVAIVGAGKLGFKVAEALLGGDYAITIIDKNEDVLHKLSQHLDVMTINADAKDISKFSYKHLHYSNSKHLNLQEVLVFGIMNANDPTALLQGSVH